MGRKAENSLPSTVEVKNGGATPPLPTCINNKKFSFFVHFIHVYTLHLFITLVFLTSCISWKMTRVAKPVRSIISKLSFKSYENSSI
jgi:hypothetical protein